MLPRLFSGGSEWGYSLVVVNRLLIVVASLVAGSSLVAQLVKNPLAMRENWVRSLGSISGLGRSPGEGNGYPLQYSSLENPMERESLTGYSPCGGKGSDTTERLTLLLLLLWRSSSWVHGLL